jgi:hypothetical protein
MKTQQIFLSNRNRDSGTPNDMFITFRNGLIKELSTSTVPPRVSIELVEFAITRLWYDVQTGINDTFSVYRVVDQRTLQSLFLRAGTLSVVWILLELGPQSSLFWKLC